MTVKFLNRIIINLYLITAMLSIYMPLKTISLTALVVFSFYFTAFLFIEKSRVHQYVNKYILLILSVIICSTLINQSFLYGVINVTTVCAIYYLIIKERNYVIRKISVYIILFSLVNFGFYSFLEPDYSSAKILGDVLIERVQLDILPLSITSVIALLSLILAGKLENKMLMLLVIGINIFVIFKLGKISVILALVIIHIIVYFVLPVQRIINKNLFKYAFKLVYTFMFLFPFLVVSFNEYLNSDFIRLITFRDQIFSSYIKYTFENWAIFFGNGFVNNEENSGLLHTNPHNQALGIFFNLGLFGLIVYLLTFLKILDNTLVCAKHGDTYSFKIFFTMSMLMMSDSYYVLTVFPMYLVFFMFFLVGLPCNQSITNRLIKRN